MAGGRDSPLMWLAAQGFSVSSAPPPRAAAAAATAASSGPPAPCTRLRQRTLDGGAAQLAAADDGPLRQVVRWYEGGGGRRPVSTEGVPAHPPTFLWQGHFTLDALHAPVPRGLRGALAPPKFPLLLSAWTWVPRPALTPSARVALRDALVVTPRSFQGGAGRRAASWARAHGRSSTGVKHKDVAHEAGRMPMTPRDAWAPGALPYYREASEGSKAPGLWVPPALARRLWGAAAMREAVDRRCEGLPLRGCGAPPAMTFLPHVPQKQAHDAVLGTWRAQGGGGPCMAVLPCGTGKSVIAAHIARSAGRRFVWVILRQMLVEGAEDAIRGVFPGARKWTPPRKTRRRKGAPSADAAAAAADDGAARPFTYAVWDGTAPKALHPATADVDALIVSIHTLRSRAARMRCADWAAYGTLIVDEAHMMSHTFLHALASVPIKRVVAFTATPHRGDGTTRALYWSFGPLVFTYRRPSMSLCGMAWLWEGGPPLKVRGARSDDALDASDPAVLNALIAQDAHRADMLVLAGVAAAGQGRHVMCMGERVAYLQDLTARMREGLPGLPPVRVPLPPGTVPPGAVGSEAWVGDGVLEVAPESVTIAAAATIHQGTPGWLRSTVLHTARVVGMHPGIAQFGISCKTLDTIILATPMRNVEQIVGRITRANSVGKVPLVLDLVDAAQGLFTSSWTARRQTYTFLDMDMDARRITRPLCADEVSQLFAPFA